MNFIKYSGELTYNFNDLRGTGKGHWLGHLRRFEGLAKTTPIPPGINVTIGGEEVELVKTGDYVLKTLVKDRHLRYTIYGNKGKNRSNAILVNIPKKE